MVHIKLWTDYRSLQAIDRLLLVDRSSSHLGESTYWSLQPMNSAQASVMLLGAQDGMLFHVCVSLSLSLRVSAASM